MTGQRIGILGGTFDPPHLGHLAAAEDVAAQLRLNRVVFLPNRQPPHKEGALVSAVRDRVAMVQLAVADNTRFSVSLMELERHGPSYTLETMRLLRARFPPDVGLFFLAGCDALNQLHTWHEPDSLVAEFTIVIMERPLSTAVNWPSVEQRFPGIRKQVILVDVTALDISSSDVRRRVEGGRPFRYYVPPAVSRYISEHHLYRSRGPPSAF